MLEGAEVGRVLRVGRGWADVEVNRKVRRVSTRPDLIVRAGSYLQIIQDQGISLMSSREYTTRAAQHLH